MKCSLIYSNRLVYLLLIKVLVYGNSPPKIHEKSYTKILAKTLKNT